ncbi:MAG TPA: hypothetical protein DCX95_06225 [Elusimicrobia bacterium]|nr:hypothetical protein [Elusimicrobiota bacterium]
MQIFVNDGGKIFACGMCLKIRQSEGSEMCSLSTMKDLYEIVKWADKVIVTPPPKTGPLEIRV